MKTPPWFLNVLLMLAGLAGLNVCLPNDSMAAQMVPSAIPGNPVATTPVLPSYRPVLFEENRGQFDGQVRFLVRGNGYDLFLTDDEAVMSLMPSVSDGLDQQAEGASVIRMRLLDASQSQQMEPLGEQLTISHYYTGAVSEAWKKGVPSYAKVRYEAVYPGIDLVYYGREGLVEYDFIVAPGADPSHIGLGYTGVESLFVDASGDLLLETSAGVMMQHAPVVYQDNDGIRTSIASRYRTENGRVFFQLAAYDQSLPLIIDPALSYASYLGGSFDDVINDIAVDDQGAIYVTGQTFSADFPGVSTTMHQGGADVFVSKFSAAGELLFTSYLGGSGSISVNGLESGNALAIDAAGNIYVTGLAVLMFPVLNNGGVVCDTLNTDVFVARLGVDDGALLYSDCFGGSGQDAGQGLALDNVGNVYVTGWTGSDDFVGDGLGAGDRDGFVFKLSSSGVREYSTNIGGSLYDRAEDITLVGDALYIVGATNSTDLVSAGSGYAGDIDAFVTKLRRDDGGIVWSRYIGGSGADGEIAGPGDIHQAIASDSSGAVYITGQTYSDNFPLSNAYQEVLKGGSDMFVTKLSAAGAIQLSTYLGSSGDDAGHDLAVNAAGDSILLTGWSSADDFPATETNSAGFPYQGLNDVVITRLGATFYPQYALYYGGSADDAAHAVALQSDGGVYIGGSTSSSELAYVDQYPLARADAAGGVDGFVARIGADIDLDVDVAMSSDNGSLAYTITVSNNGPGLATHVVVMVQLSEGLFYSSSDSQCVNNALQGIALCDLGQLAAEGIKQISVMMDVGDPAALAPGVTVSANEFDTDLSNNGFGATVIAGAASPPLLVVTDGDVGDGGGSSGGGGMGLLFVILFIGLGGRCVMRGCSVWMALKAAV